MSPRKVAVAAVALLAAAVAGAATLGPGVGTASSHLLLLEVQPEGRRAMPAADWARGYGVAPGTRLGQV